MEEARTQPTTPCSRPLPSSSAPGGSNRRRAASGKAAPSSSRARANAGVNADDGENEEPLDLRPIDSEVESDDFPFEPTQEYTVRKYESPVKVELREKELAKIRAEREAWRAQRSKQRGKAHPSSAPNEVIEIISSDDEARPAAHPPSPRKRKRRQKTRQTSIIELISSDDEQAGSSTHKNLSPRKRTRSAVSVIDVEKPNEEETRRAPVAPPPIPEVEQEEPPYQEFVDASPYALPEQHDRDFVNVSTERGIAPAVIKPVQDKNQSRIDAGREFDEAMARLALETSLSPSCAVPPSSSGAAASPTSRVPSARDPPAMDAQAKNLPGLSMPSPESTPPALTPQNAPGPLVSLQLAPPPATSANLAFAPNETESPQLNTPPPPLLQNIAISSPASLDSSHSSSVSPSITPTTPALSAFGMSESFSSSAASTPLNTPSPPPSAAPSQVAAADMEMVWDGRSDMKSLRCGEIYGKLLVRLQKLDQRPAPPQTSSLAGNFIPVMPKSAARRLADPLVLAMTLTSQVHDYQLKEEDEELNGWTLQYPASP